MKNSTKFPHVMFLLFLALGVKATPVDMRTAGEVAMKFMNANAKMPLRSMDELQLVTTYNIARGDAAFYIFNTSNGFVIVSADDCVTPILGYSDEGRPFYPDNVPIQLQDYLQGFVEQIEFGIENHLEADEQIARKWELVRTIGRLTENRTNERVLPLLSTTWDQGCYYNALCPEDPDGDCGHVVTGCTATAMAQIMRYWGYPEHGIGYHSYTPNGYPEQCVDFGATTYDWENMPNNLNGSSSTEQIDAVATLMWHCGVSVDMNYGPGASGAFFSPSSLINYFGYSDEMSLEDRSWYSDASWKVKLKDCLNLNRPVYYIGFPEVGDGHAFVCDGYDNYDLFHFNWGWNGLGNGFFFIDDLTISCLYVFGSGYVALDIGGYNNGQKAIFNIHPQTETTNYAINVSADNVGGGTVSGGGYFTHGSSVTLSAIANNGYHFCYWRENGGIASTDPNYSFTANFNRTLVAVFAEPFTITVTASEGGAASGSGSFLYGQPCTVTATADEGYGFANWTKDGMVVSVDANYTFSVTGERHLTAHFVAEENIVFADNNVKAICVANWDRNGDGELSYVESAEVTSLGEVFRGNAEITSFDELQYFISLTSIDNSAFCDCTGLNTIKIPNSVTSIGNSAFQSCSGFTGMLSIPNSVTSIGDSAFQGCSGFTGNLIIPTSVTTIGRYAFSGCSGFTGSLTIPNSVIKIEREAFSGCSGFVGSLTIPNSVRVINILAFSACSGFSSLIVQAEIPAWVALLAFEWIPTTIPVYVPFESVEAYQQADGWNAFSNIIGICSSGTITVSADPFEGGEVSGGGTYEGGSSCNVVAMPNEGYYFANWTKNNNVVSLDANYTFLVTDDALLTAHFIPEGNIVFADANVKSICVANWDTNGDSELSYVEAASVKSLGEVFSGNTEITSFEELQFFIGLTSISSYAFNNCSGLAGSLILPSYVKSIDPYAFAGCSGFTGDLIIPNSVTTISSYAFADCSGFTGSLTIPNSVTLIADNAFYNCSGFTGSLSIPNSVTTIGNYVFYNCSGFTGSLSIPNSVTTIGHYAFYNCSGLTGSLSIGNSVVYIGYGAFCYCQGLTGELLIPNTVTWISAYAFFYCYGLTSLILTNSVTSIDDSAFCGCYGLTSMMVLSEIPPSLGIDVFVYVTTDIPVYVPFESVEAYQSAEGWDNFSNIIGMCASVTITAASEPVEGGVVAGAGTYSYYSNCTLTATANQGYTFVGWAKDGVLVSTNASYSITVTEEAHYIAHFTLNQYFITVAANPSEGGNVYGGAAYLYGDNCTLTASANDDYRFVRWTKNGVQVSTDISYTFTVTENANYIGHFESNHYQINVSADPMDGGSITGSGTYILGQTATLTVTPNEGYVFQNWSEFGEIVSEEATYSFEVTRNRNLVAHLLFVNGVEENHNVDVSVYPNPTTNKVTVEASQIINRWEIITTTGSLVYSSDDNTDKKEFWVNHLAPGTYLIRMTMNNAVLTSLFVRKK